jgi:hypothetical protein
MLLISPHMRRRDPARLPSISVQSILAECDSDVLLLYDCCHAILTTTGITGRGVKEFLAACGFESIAPEVGQDSFTHALIQELGKASYSSVSVGELYGRLIDRLRTWKPCITKNELGQMRLNSEGKPLYERPRRKTPIHCALTNEPKRRSIILSPLPVAPGALGFPILSGPSSTDQPRKKKRYTYPTEDEGEDEDDDIEDITECPQVILSIRVDTAQFDLDAWLEWIKDVPPEATKVKVEGIYGSLSTLLLLRMPIATWSLLPNDTAYSFIGFVTTKNLAPNFQSLSFDNVDVQADRATEEMGNVVSGLADSLAPLSLSSGPPKQQRGIRKGKILESNPAATDSTDDKAEAFKSARTSRGDQKAGESNDEDELEAKEDTKAKQSHKANEDSNPEEGPETMEVSKAKPISTKDDILPPVPTVHNTYSRRRLHVRPKGQRFSAWTCVSVP